MIYPIVAYGDPVLRKEARDIVPGEIDVKKLADDMFETMYAASGVGLAAPQIGLAGWIRTNSPSLVGLRVLPHRCKLCADYTTTF